MNFVRNIQKSDYSAVRSDLHSLIRKHRLIFSISQSEFSQYEGGLKYEDLTHDLFLSLWAKKRFEHYVNSNMTDSEIRTQLSQLEITNLLVSKIQKLKPEHFRLARRISKIVRQSKRFKIFGGDSALRFKVFGLSSWAEKPTRSLIEMEQTSNSVKVPMRDCRLKGRGKQTQLIISDRDLENLIFSIFTAIDTVCSIEILRDLILLKLPLFDVQLNSITNSDNDGLAYDLEITDETISAEQKLLNAVIFTESFSKSEILADEFLTKITSQFKTKIGKQTKLMLKTLYFCYLVKSKLTQFEIAFRLGVSDSLLSDYRKRIHTELQNLGIRSLDQAHVFQTYLLKKVEILLSDEL